MAGINVKLIEEPARVRGGPSNIFATLFKSLFLFKNICDYIFIGW